MIELIAAAGVRTLGQDIPQPKNPLKRKAIEWITKAEGGGEGSGSGASGVGSSQ